MSLSSIQYTVLNDLIESELGAVETYRELVNSCVGEAPSARNEFRQLEINHRHSVEALSRHLGMSEPPPLSPGKWKRFIVAMHDTFSTLDNPSMVAALKDGETKLVEQYKTALQAECLDADAGVTPAGVQIFPREEHKGS